MHSILLIGISNYCNDVIFIVICIQYVYSQTSLVSTPGDPPNCYSLSVVLANHIDWYYGL